MCNENGSLIDKRCEITLEKKSFQNLPDTRQITLAKFDVKAQNWINPFYGTWEIFYWKFISKIQIS